MVFQVFLYKLLSYIKLTMELFMISSAFAQSAAGGAEVFHYRDFYHSF